MRMFLIGMCDVFLMLYLTAMISAKPATVLTVEDFYQLKAMHETLQTDKAESEAELRDRLRQLEDENERLLVEKRLQEDLAAAEIAEKQARLKEMERNLVLSDSERERINQDLRIKEAVLKKREALLENLNQEIAAKERMRRKMQEIYQMKLENERKAVEESQTLAEQLKSKADNAQNLANQMKEEMDLAYKIAATAKTVQQRALELKDQALQEKQEAELTTQEALAARQRAEAEKQKALEVLQAEKESKREAQQIAQNLAVAIKNIKQDGEAAYQKNMRPKMQTINVTYERTTGNDAFVYRRALNLLPVEIDGANCVIFPSRQIGFTGWSDKAPDKLAITYLGEQVKSGWINTQNNLIAFVLPGFEGQVQRPYPPDTEIRHLMPALLALRNNGNVGLTDKLRGIAEDYFIVNRDYLEPDEDGNLKFAMRGWRGTGARAEHIVIGDQLVDLNGRLIGISNESDRVIRMDTLNGWTKINFTKEE